MYEKSISLLNKAVADELTAIHQYLYFHFHCQDQGLSVLSALFHNTAIEEMKHVGKLSERILFLKGDVNMQAAESIKPITTVKEMLTLASQMEAVSMREYNRWANECSAGSDAASRQIFESLVLDEEKHYDRFSKELDNFSNHYESYMALQLIEDSKQNIKG